MYAVYHGPEGLTAIAARVAPQDGDAGATAGDGWACTLRDCKLLRHHHGRGRRPAGRDPRPRRGRAHQSADHPADDAQCDQARHLARRDHDAPPSVEAVWRAFGGEPRRFVEHRGLDASTGCRNNLARRTSDFLDPPGLPPVSLRDRDAALHAPAGRPRSRARPHHDPARLLHDEAQRHGRDDADHLAGVLRPASVRAGRAGAGLCRDVRRSRSESSARSPATTRSRCSRIPARRANMPGCWRSAPITAAAARRIATSA